MHIHAFLLIKHVVGIPKKKNRSNEYGVTGSCIHIRKEKNQEKEKMKKKSQNQREREKKRRGKCFH
ncbi:hypothetical protein HYC85_017176 [Camellia sinensis]|uniref:Uncharacterized protein n=1 Tax=Camellia sinensis TaxID=4442 RepID=A0A7J7H5F0_CAMSI|nr:hypothetical protein HYC85_017176 [Camellia sinensis]